jgi:hypothetical protein
MDLQHKQINGPNSGVAFSMDERMKSFLFNRASTKPKKPNEIPVPGREPETIPAEEPGPGVWPKKEPEIQPEREPLTIPPTSPPEVPRRPENY